MDETDFEKNDPGVKVEVDAVTRESQVVDAIDGESAYDASCKKVLAEKSVLARMLKHAVEEFFDCDEEDIRDRYIEGIPEIGIVPVHRDEQMPVIQGTNNEDVTIKEGVVRFDVKFTALAPIAQKSITLIINIEAQRRYDTPYPILKRAFYNCARMMSQQYGTQFTKSDYGKLKKVYSLWIILFPPKYRQNTIVRYSTQEEILFGKIKDSKKDLKSDYDLMSVIIISLGDPEVIDNHELLMFLGTLLNEDMEAERKKQILFDDLNFSMTPTMEDEVKVMCNLSQSIKEKNLAKGKAEGVEEKSIEDVDALLDLLDDETISERIKVDLDVVKERRRLMFGE
jgi:hypothetical protein